jgi:hypothetical protein
VLGVVYLLFNEGYLTSSRHEPAGTIWPRPRIGWPRCCTG